MLRSVIQEHPACRNSTICCVKTIVCPQSMQPRSFLNACNPLLENDWLIQKSLIGCVGIESQFSCNSSGFDPQLSYEFHFSAISKFYRTQISAATVEKDVISQMTEITNSH